MTNITDIIKNMFQYSENNNSENKEDTNNTDTATAEVETNERDDDEEDDDEDNENGDDDDGDDDGDDDEEDDEDNENGDDGDDEGDDDNEAYDEDEDEETETDVQINENNEDVHDGDNHDEETNPDDTIEDPIEDPIEEHDKEDATLEYPPDENDGDDEKDDEETNPDTGTNTDAETNFDDDTIADHETPYDQFLMEDDDDSEEEDASEEEDDDMEEENEEDELTILPIPMNPSVKHIYSEKAYYYELEDILDKSPLTIDLKGDNSPIDYYLYMYILVNNRDVNPYLLCLLEYDEDNKLYQFPQIQYTPYSIKTAQDEKDNVHEIEINNLCFTKILSVFHITETNIHDDQLFGDDEYLMKSVLQHNSKQIIPIRTDDYVKYLTTPSNDANTIMNLSQYYSSNDKTKPPQYVWCSLDEIMRKKKVYNNTIHSDVYELFLKNKMYHTIRDDNMSIAETPRMMYSCYIPENTRQNEFITERNNNTLLPNMSSYENYGDLYFFSDDLLHMDDYQSIYIYSIPRYIVFLGTASILGDNELITSFHENQLPYNSVRFSYEINTLSGHETTTIVGVVSPELFYNF
jgi:hypothetical protein